ncbi:MAG: bifunctional diaminohydroxyphosphoribosylaminopyrimidine deaminase/5-amino-6-(5-phosphoribosylamino)uracil reductase RibD [Myxococcota bacterium]
MSKAAAGDVDRRMMALALRLGRKGRPSPNPHVGAVVVRDGEVVGRGHHERAGLAHAEVVALREAGERARGATLYVTFEPCNHHGRTGPCTDAVLESEVGRVVIGCRDPAPHVPGAIERLRQAGIDVQVGLREEEARRLIDDFAKHIRTGLPWVTLKAAVTLDGRMATTTGDSKWITGARARKEAHRMRDRSDAVLVGVGTAIADDPQLTVRHVRGADPLRAVLDAHLRTPPGSQLIRHRSPRPTVIFHGPEAPAERREALERPGVELVEVPETEPGRLDAVAVLRELGQRDVVRLLVEGGPTVHAALLETGQADGVAVFVAPVVLGAAAAPAFAAGVGVERMADAWRIRAPRVQRLGADVLIEGAFERRGEG